MPPLSRRTFLASAAVPLLAPGRRGSTAVAEAAREISADLVIVGGGFGGCAAALAACRAGLRVVMTEETDWIGGQVTSQAVPPDEHPWIERFGCTRSYRSYRDGVRAYYRTHYPLSPAARAEPHLNPGGGRVSSLCHEPRVSLAVLTGMLAPFVSGRRLRVLTEHVAVSAEVDGDRVRAVTVEDRSEGRSVALTAPYFADATELGDLLPLTGTEHVVGAESRAETGEESAPDGARPHAQQAFACCFAIDHVPGADHTIRSKRMPLTRPACTVRAAARSPSARSNTSRRSSTWSSPAAVGSSATASKRPRCSVSPPPSRAIAYLACSSSLK